MNNQFSTDHEQHLPEAVDRMIDAEFTSATQRNLQLLRTAMDAGHDAVHNHSLPFTCFKCGTGCEDWDGGVCETCGEWFCDDHLVTDQQVMAPEACHACDRENRAILDTHDTMPKGRD